VVPLLNALPKNGLSQSVFINSTDFGVSVLEHPFPNLYRERHCFSVREHGCNAHGCIRGDMLPYLRAVALGHLTAARLIIDSVCSNAASLVVACNVNGRLV